MVNVLGIEAQCQSHCTQTVRLKALLDRVQIETFFINKYQLFVILDLKAVGLLTAKCDIRLGGIAYRVVMTLSGIALGFLGTLAVWTFWVARKRPKVTGAGRTISQLS